jgi:molecular chaperone HscA
MTLLEIFDPKARPRPVGIDLGTTNSLVARVRDGKPMCITACDGGKLLPSAVHYDPRGNVIVGAEALRLAALAPRETIVSVKRFMGRGADDPETAPRHVRVRRAEERRRREERALQVRDRVVSPVEVSAEILRSLKPPRRGRAAHRGRRGDHRARVLRRRTAPGHEGRGAARGLDVLRLLNEPTAAALAYGLEKQHERPLRGVRPRRRHVRHHDPSPRQTACSR